ncbi:MAG: hypothetical protein AAGC73_09655, partial [Verrucomicrobiota bacterium]
MILFVNMEHVHLQQVNPDYWEQVVLKRITAKLRFEQLSGLHCQIVHYTNFDLEIIEDFQPSLIIFSGHNTDLTHYDARHLAKIKNYFTQPRCP